MFNILFDIKEIVHKEFVLVGQEQIRHTTVKIYGDYVKMCENFAPNFGDKELDVASQQCTISRFLF
jgi:hypothetical protein